MSITRKAVTRLTMDLSMPDVQGGFTCTLGDRARRLEILVVNGGEAFQIPPRWSAILTGTKPDGTELMNGCVVQNGRIIYEFESGEQIATCAGGFPVTLWIVDETGASVATPKFWVNVIESGARMIVESNDQFTVLQDLIGAVTALQIKDEEVDASLRTIQPKLSNLLAINTTKITAGAWTDSSPFMEMFGSAAYKKGDIIMLLPANDETRDAAGRARLSVTTELAPAESGGYTYIVARAEGKEAPGIDMEFIRIILNDETDHEPRISLVGIDTTAADIDRAVEEAKEAIENTVKVETVSVTWGPNYSQSIQLKGISDPDNVFFFIPADTTTRDVITRAGMTVSTTATYAPTYSMFFTTATVKNIAPIKGKTLNFTVLHVREPGATERRTVLVGVDSSDDIPTSIDLSRLDEGIINETFGGSSASKTTTIEYDEDGNPVKITDGDGNETVITW